MLFFAANDDQIACIKKGLELFCRALGQKVNFHKSKMFCSPCVSDQDAARMSSSLGIPLTKDLSKHLGHHLIHKDDNREAHKELMQIINNHLESWKMKCLSRAG